MGNHMRRTVMECDTTGRDKIGRDACGREPAWAWTAVSVSRV